MKNGINVLSLFDGLSCGNIALERAGIKVDNYFACEIDRYAIQIANKNYPIFQMGDVKDLTAGVLPKIDLLIGGSPCQDLSFAGKGKGLEGDRSSLFYQYVRLLKECKPKYFLLENVRMKQEYQDIISDLLGVQPVKINSSLVSAQNRVRLYWTNIPNVTQPEDKGILLKDILESNPDQSFNSGHQKSGGKHSNMLNTTYKSQANTIHNVNKKSPTICSGTHGYALGHIERPCEPKEFNKNSLCHHVATATDIKGNESIKRVYADSGKSPTLTTMGGGHREPKVNTSETTYRKLTPLECERLQTIPDGYTSGVSNTQRYKMLGNSWTADVIAHLFKGLKDGE